jgi:hypothetical protein
MAVDRLPVTGAADLLPVVVPTARDIDPYNVAMEPYNIVMAVPQPGHRRKIKFLINNYLPKCNRRQIKSRQRLHFGKWLYYEPLAKSRGQHDF